MIQRTPSGPAPILPARTSPSASRLHTGDALEFLSEQKKEFDIIFNDVDKEDYPRVLRIVAPHLRKGGLFITDNVLWSGRVAEKNPTRIPARRPSWNSIANFTIRRSSSRRYCRSVMVWQSRSRSKILRVEILWQTVVKVAKL